MNIYSTNWLRVHPWFFRSPFDPSESGSSVCSICFCTCHNCCILCFTSFQLMDFCSRSSCLVAFCRAVHQYHFFPIYCTFPRMTIMLSCFIACSDNHSLGHATGFSFVCFASTPPNTHPPALSSFFPRLRFQ